MVVWSHEAAISVRFHVKHQGIEQIDSAEVSTALASVRVNATSDQAELLAAHTNAVLTENAHMNLTRVTERDQVLRLHIADSATVVPVLAGLEPGRIIDIGSGAGYPGFCLRILLGWDTTLAESVKKKAAFLERAAALLDLQITVSAERAEEIALHARNEYQYVVARAVSSLPSLVELASPLLSKDGRLVAMKGDIDPEEVRRADLAAKQCGMSRVETISLELPGGEKRAIISYAKSGKPKLDLPRRSGMAQRHPLA